MPGAGQAWVVLTACLVDQLRAGFESTRDNYLEQIQIQQQLQQTQLKFPTTINQQKQFDTEDEYQVAAIAATKLLMMRATATTTNSSQQQKFEDEERYQQKLSQQNCKCHSSQQPPTNRRNSLENQPRSCCVTENTNYDYNRVENDYGLQLPLYGASLFNYAIDNATTTQSCLLNSPNDPTYFQQQNSEQIPDSSQLLATSISRLSLTNNKNNLETQFQQ